MVSKYLPQETYLLTSSIQLKNDWESLIKVLIGHETVASFSTGENETKRMTLFEFIEKQIWPDVGAVWSCSAVCRCHTTPWRQQRMVVWRGEGGGMEEWKRGEMRHRSRTRRHDWIKQSRGIESIAERGSHEVVIAKEADPPRVLYFVHRQKLSTLVWHK